MKAPVIDVFEGRGIKGIALAGAASLAAAVVSSGMAARQTLPILCNNLDRVVAIAVDRDPLDFNLTRREAGAMFDHGYATAVRYLDHHPVGA